MGRFDLGVFVDAHHLLEVEPAQRKASDVLLRVQIAAEDRCMSFGMANRLVVADCSDARARAIAEDFGAAGFVIRHVPDGVALSRGQVLTAQIIEAVADREELRTIAVVAPEDVPLSVADALHRSGRALIACTAGATRASAALDELVTLSLDSTPLRSLIVEAVQSLRAAGRDEVRIPEMESTLRRLKPGFTAAAYGMTTKQALKIMSGSGFRFVAPDRAVLHTGNGVAGAGNGSNGSAATAVPAAEPGLAKAMMSACSVLPEVAPDDEKAVVRALRSVLDLAEERHQLREVAMGPGLTIQTVCAGLGVVAAGYRSMGFKAVDLCHLAADGTAWTVFRNPDKPEDIRLQLSGGPAPGGP